MKVHISPAWISPSMGAWRRSDPGAVPFGEHREVARALPSWKGKTVIDAMNMLVPLEELA
jgi:hypothetical protein